MHIANLTPEGYVKTAMNTALQVRFLAILRKVAWIAEQAVNVARNLPSPPVEMRKGPHQPNYIDDTGNLRNSIGYMLAVDGEVFQANFIAEQAEKLAQKALEGKYKKGISLILTAGMEYAGYVEAHGYDVLTSAELFCKEQFKKMISKYKAK